MMMKKNKLLIILLVMSFLTVSLNALSVPSLTGRVVDNAGVLSTSAEKELNRYLESLEQSTGSQLAVLTIPSLKGDSLEDYSIRVTDEWKLGQSGKDNGVLLLVALEERKIRIEVGYGLEGQLTDAKSGYIIRNLIAPYFKEGDYASGIMVGIQSIGGVISGGEDITPSRIQESRTEHSSRSLPLNFIIILFVIFLNSFGRIGRRGGLLRMLFWGSLFSNASRSRGGFGGGWSSGGGGFGGGGGFSGGGGGFGGGGASGGW